jgi:hypothetical protein
MVTDAVCTDDQFREAEAIMQCSIRLFCTKFTFRL